MPSDATADNTQRAFQISVGVEGSKISSLFDMFLFFSVIIGSRRDYLGELRGACKTILKRMSDNCLNIFEDFCWQIRDPSGSIFVKNLYF